MIRTEQTHSKWSNIRTKVRMIFATVFALVVAGAARPPVGVSFDAGVARLKVLATEMKARRIGYDLVRSEADFLVFGYGSSEIDYFRSRIDDNDKYASHLALLTLAGLSKDKKATEILVDYARCNGNRDVLILTYAPAPLCLVIADEALTRSETQPDALVMASALFRFFGDAPRASSLEAALARPSFRNTTAQEKARENLTALRQRLARRPEDYIDWADQDLYFWRARQSISDDRDLNSGIEIQIRMAYSKKYIHEEYLKERLKASCIDPIELRMLQEIQVKKTAYSLRITPEGIRSR